MMVVMAWLGEVGEGLAMVNVGGAAGRHGVGKLAARRVCLVVVDVYRRSRRCW